MLLAPAITVKPLPRVYSSPTTTCPWLWAQMYRETRAVAIFHSLHRRCPFSQRPDQNAPRGREGKRSQNDLGKLISATKPFVRKQFLRQQLSSSQATGADPAG